MLCLSFLWTTARSSPPQVELNSTSGFSLVLFTLFYLWTPLSFLLLHRQHANGSFFHVLCIFAKWVLSVCAFCSCKWWCCGSCVSRFLISASFESPSLLHVSIVSLLASFSSHHSPCCEPFPFFPFSLRGTSRLPPPTLSPIPPQKTLQ